LAVSSLNICGQLLLEEILDFLSLTPLTVHLKQCKSDFVISHSSAE